MCVSHVQYENPGKLSIHKTYPVAVWGGGMLEGLCWLGRGAGEWYIGTSLSFRIEVLIRQRQFTAL